MVLFNSIPEQEPWLLPGGGICVLAILPVLSSAHITPFWEQFPLTSFAPVFSWVGELNQLTSGKQVWALALLFRVNQPLDTVR